MNEQEEIIFKKLLDENQSSIYRICKIYAVAPLETQDLFQEVLFQIWTSLPNFKDKSSLSTWVYRIALNVCMRSKQQLSTGKLTLVKLDSIEFKMSEQMTDSNETERYNALHTCIELLPEGDRSLLILHLESLPYKEIAEIWGNSSKRERINIQVASLIDELKEKMTDFERKSIESDVSKVKSAWTKTKGKVSQFEKDSISRDLTLLSKLAKKVLRFLKIKK